MKILLVDDEEQVLKGVSRIISCEEDDWEVDTSLSGAEALDMLEEESFDVVVTDMRMPGMDGAELLQEIGSLYPSMLRVVLSGQADRESVLRAVKPMHQYLSKPCDPTTLIEVINRASIFQETIGTSEVLDAIGRANCMPALPEIVTDINREIDQGGNSEAIAKILSKDAVLSARILQLANSSIFAQRTPVADIARAVSLVGMDMIRSLAMQQAVYCEHAGDNNVLSARQLLDHGFQVALMGKQLAKKEKCSRFDADVIFSASLLHDVGKIILLNAFPEKYKSILDQAKTTQQSVGALEMQTFGGTHSGIGGYLFSLWGLPAEVIDAVAAHHSFEACSLCDGNPRQFVFAANWIANKTDDGELEAFTEECDDKTSAKRFAVKVSQWRQYLAENEEQE